MTGRRVAHHQPDRDRRQRREDDDGTEHRPPADRLRRPGQRRGGGEVAEQADRQHHGCQRRETVRRKPARDHHHAADQHHAAAGAHQCAAGQQHRPVRRQREQGAAEAGDDEHADHGIARPETIEEEAAGNLHRGEAEEERAGQRAQGFRPDRQVAHQIEADGDVGGAEKMAGDIGGGQCRDDDQAPAVGQRPLGGLHRLKGRFRFVFLLPRAYADVRRSSTSNPPSLLPRQRHAAERQHRRHHLAQAERLALVRAAGITPINL